MKITLTCETVEEAQGILFLVGQRPLNEAAQLYGRLHQQIQRQIEAARGEPPVPPAAPIATKKRVRT
jgi:hypothetical protein